MTRTCSSRIKTIVTDPYVMNFCLKLTTKAAWLTLANTATGNAEEHCYLL